jgi:hypothetical protein
MVSFRPASPLTPALALAALAALLADATAGPSPDFSGAKVTRYEIATRDDLLFAHLLAPLMKGEVPDWILLGDLSKQLGGWVDQYVSARQVAGLIAEAFPVEGQAALGPLERVVGECADTLGVPKPTVHVRNSPLT